MFSDGVEAQKCTPFMYIITYGIFPFAVLEPIVWTYPGTWNINFLTLVSIGWFIYFFNETWVFHHFHPLTNGCLVHEGENMAISFAIFWLQRDFLNWTVPTSGNDGVTDGWSSFHKWHLTCLLEIGSEENIDIYFRYFTSLVVSKWQLFCFIARDLDLFPYFGFLFSFRLDMSLTWRHKDCVSMKLAPNWSEIFSRTAELDVTLFCDSEGSRTKPLQFVELTPYPFVDQLLLNVVPPVSFQMAFGVKPLVACVLDSNEIVWVHGTTSKFGGFLMGATISESTTHLLGGAAWPFQMFSSWQVNILLLVSTLNMTMIDWKLKACLAFLKERKAGAHTLGCVPSQDASGKV